MDELNEYQLRIEVAKSLSYHMEIVSIQHHGTFWQITFPDTRGKSWVCDKDKNEEYAWGRAFEEGWIPEYASDMNAAIELVAGMEDFHLNVDQGEWEALIGNQWDDNATVYSYRHKEAAYAICRAWLAWKTAQP